MIKAACTALLAAATLATGAARAQALYSPPEGDFEIAFPDSPAVRVQPAARSKDVAARRYVDEQPGRALMVSISDYPDGALPASADAGVYDRMLRIRADDEEGRLIDTKAARLSGRPCLEGVIASKGATEIVRILMVGQRVYELTYVAPEGADPAGADAAFFGSFRIRSGGAAPASPP